MERFTADLHVHSRFSRATSKSLTIRNLAAWGRLKGISVLGTGDFTHPEWLAEIEEQLVDGGQGLFALRHPGGLEAEIPEFEGPIPGRTRFMLQAEISSIYKRGGKVRKVHNLVYMPDLAAAKRFNERLAQVGNLASDGRPILGLDCRNLMDMVLECHPQAFLVPAHIWTPWFSLFGSKSGFDSIRECFGDYAPEVFAMETGLSSDPEMNWTWSELDRIKLISNSDAHSGEKLGREVNMFRGEMSYEGIYRALRGEGLGHRFLGTVEFFPEEGKYHMDGHRKCGVVMDPHETIARGAICPVCGKPVTVGVYNRILELADRQEPVRPQGAPDFVSLIPLREVLSEVVGTGSGSKKVTALYMRLIREFGSELDILQRVPPEDLSRHSCHLGEGIKRMREGNVIRKPGFDGEFGVIQVFNDKERAQIRNGATLIPMDAPKKDTTGPAPVSEPVCQPLSMPQAAPIAPNPAQQAAIDAGPGPVLVLAGPGTGKTQTLMGRVARLIKQGEPARRILALTFTRRAAQELRDRLKTLRGENAELPQAGTLHSLCFDYWKHAYSETPIVLPEAAAKKLFAEVNPEFAGKNLDHHWTRYNLGRERLTDLPADLAEAHISYGNQKNHWDLVDYTDLLEFMLEQAGAPTFRMPYTQVLVDEVQDLTPLQLAVIRGIAGPSGEGVFLIGDPNQSIYGFRGAAGDIQARLTELWPAIQSVTLTENYRSAQNILDCAGALFPEAPKLHSHVRAAASIHLFEGPDDIREATWISDRIKGLIGTTSHSLADAGEHGELAPGDIAVLVRFKALIPIIHKTLKRAGIPCSTPELEGFWQEPRVASILHAAERFLGMALGGVEDVIDVPDHILAKGPVGLAAYLSETPPFDQFFWESRQFKELKHEFELRGGWQGLVNWVSLQSELELVRRSAEKVQIMSLHAAKGLEFEAVFMPACEEGILPFAGMDLLTAKITLTPGRGQRFPEERRLMYVGMTRAKQSLYLSRAARRQLYGKTLSLPPSRYLREIPEALLIRSTLTARKVTREKQLGLLD
ncbi:MAG: UvrD-helicase domain-containing protein [Pseudodesulfovibrio sp.]|nr:MULTISPECIES: UvrD-helicase domain-containing protein [Pseudodesulfovibrio]MBU4191933.1 UvrD-helicase domain-containing protein [Pseudomonadota bacterium]MBU4243432.1 UvrD-helicase domain-containing protein [Pseudomonadota bacterium]MBU4380339.1 UvrD-helicase domain-containing protein [Pseudomonadota bacterium]MBU4475778.1 UvrD-helicase domain-containing protein [Pseudomonadota bacterium]MBU4516627.1 UvrD-helicase domain-containing protein [Pseudomonadota bacterium]